MKAKMVQNTYFVRNCDMLEQNRIKNLLISFSKYDAGQFNIYR